MKKKRKILSVLFVIAVLIFNPISLFLFWLFSGLYSNANPEIGESVQSVEWLPETASNISYYRTYSWQAYEFDISEDHFEDWATRWDIREVGSPISVRRYSYMGRFEEASDYSDQENQESHTAKIRNGLYDENWASDGGGYVVAYDRSEGRAYFQSNPR